MRGQDLLFEARIRGFGIMNRGFAAFIIGVRVQSSEVRVRVQGSRGEGSGFGSWG